jgi:glycosyltransferase involved in cell wall biosynthesis
MTMSTKPKVAVAMLGARMHYAVPRILNDAGMLHRFFTDSYVGNKPMLDRALAALPARLRSTATRRLAGRQEKSIPGTLVTSFDRLGFQYALARRKARDGGARADVYERFNTRFNHAVLRHGLGQADTLWGFNTACREMFQVARRDGLATIVEQTILPTVLEEKLMREAAQDWPDWQPGLEFADQQLAAREQDEWELADRIVAGSPFVAEGLADCGVAPEKIHVLPYGVDASRFSPATARSIAGRPLRILFVGEVGMRKGVPYLLEALSRLDRKLVEARLVGTVVLDRDRLGRYADRAQILGPVPRSEMPELFRWADVFVLPSVVEGSATVTYEALMSGLPVITTPNSGSVVQDGRSGRIVPVCDIDALATAIAEYAEDLALLDRHRAGARAARAEADVTRYARDLLALFGANAQ